MNLIRKISELGITDAIADKNATVNSYPAIRLIVPAPTGRTTNGYFEEYYTGHDEPEYEDYLKKTFGDK